MWKQLYFDRMRSDNEESFAHFGQIQNQLSTKISPVSRRQKARLELKSLVGLFGSLVVSDFTANLRLTKGWKLGLVGYSTSMTLVIHIWTSSAPYGPFKECFFTGSLKLCLRVGVEINWFPLIGDRDKHSVYLTIKTTAMYCFKVSFFGQFSLAGLVG